MKPVGNFYREPSYGIHDPPGGPAIITFTTQRWADEYIRQELGENSVWKSTGIENIPHGARTIHISRADDGLDDGQ